MILPDPLAGRTMARGVRSVGVALGIAWWSLSLYTAVSGPPHESLPFVVGSLVALGIPLLWAFTSMRSLDGPVTQLQVFVLVGLLIRLADPLVNWQPAGSADYSPLNPVLTTCTAMSILVLMPRLSIPLIAVSGSVIAAQRVAVVGVAQAVTEGVDFVVADLVMLVVIWAVREGMDRRAVTTAASLDAETRATSARVRALIRERVDGLIHDKVLAALMLASRGETGEAPLLARDALRELQTTAPDVRQEPEEDSIAVITEHAHVLGLELTIVGDTWAPGREGDALRAATCEALTNVAHHAGTTRAAVRTTRSGDQYVVEITDDGSGFDVTAVRHDRLGVRQRIVGSVNAAGGRVHIRSAPGRGTRIVLTATVADEQPPKSRSWWPATMVWAIPLAAASLLSHMVIGALHLSHVVNKGIVLASFVVMPGIGVLVTTTRKHGPRWYGVMAVSVLTWAILLTNVRDPYVSDWRTWFIGSFSGLAVIVAWRRGLLASLLVIVFGTGLGVLGLELRGEHSWTPVILATIQGVIYAPAVAWIKSVIDKAGRATVEQQRLAQQAAVRAALSASLEEQITARRDAMELDVIPLLTAIASGGELGAEQRGRCRSVEASTRDQLVTSNLLTPELVAAITAARDRGCRVQVAGTGASGPGLDAFRSAASTLVALGRDGDRITLRATTVDGVTHGTAVLVGPDVAHLLEPPLPPGCTVEYGAGDSDSIVLET